MGLHRIIREFKLRINRCVSKKTLILMVIWKTRVRMWFTNFFQENKKLSRKSGQGCFQIPTEPIYSVFFHAHPLDFEQKGILPCVRMQFQLNEFDDLQEATFCLITP